MKRVIIVRIGEIFLKGNNRYFFESCLVKNIKEVLKNVKYSLVKTQNRYLIRDFDESDESKILKLIDYVFGIHSVSCGIETVSDSEFISEAIREFTPKKGSFRVTVRRADKKFPINSTEFSAMMGGVILSCNPDLSVNLTAPDNEIYVDIRENGKTLICSEKIKCRDGMPVGCSGKGLLLLSGGIDSPVAGYRMARRGMPISAVHFHSFPYTSENAKQKVLELAGIISKYTGKIQLYVVKFTEIQQQIHQKCPSEFMITIMRRIMMRIAERLAVQNGLGSIITGESLGQVASQTLESITVTNAVVKLPVLRPLIGMDKSEIIDTALDIGTYDTSILPYEDCCTVFLPKNPVIHPKLSIIEEAESALDVETLVNEAIACMEIVEIVPHY